MTKRTGYMDLVDFYYELGEANCTHEIYPSAELLEESSPCVSECGIVRVSVELEEVVKDSDYSNCTPYQEQTKKEQVEQSIKHWHEVTKAMEVRVDSVKKRITKLQQELEDVK